MVNMVLGGQTPRTVSEVVGVCPRTIPERTEHYQVESVLDLQDRSSRP